MTFKKLTGTIHLWLGLASGIVVFIVSVTGCLYAFKTEIENASQPYRFVHAEETAFMKPSELLAIAKKELPGKLVHAVQYGQKEDAAQVVFYSSEPAYYYSVFINPYHGNILKVKDLRSGDFFAFVLDGHFRLWMPNEIGQPIVASATLIFVIMLITGIILWWPKNKSAAKQRFWFRWKKNLKWKRKNYDLHNILGFYASWIVLIFALTGLIWGFQWFAGSVYWLASGGDSYTYKEAVSDTTVVKIVNLENADKLFVQLHAEYPEAKLIEVHIPEHAHSPINVAINPETGTFWKTDFINYDQHSLREIEGDKTWGRIHKAKLEAYIFRMNYDIHIGAILGLPGKILAFFASLISASLPITGFYIWWGRRKKERKKTTVNSMVSVASI